MRVKVERRKEIILKLTEEEARWLKNYLQNPLIEHEHSSDQKIRQLFWSSLKEGEKDGETED